MRRRHLAGGWVALALWGAAIAAKWLFRRRIPRLQRWSGGYVWISRDAVWYAGPGEEPHRITASGPRHDDTTGGSE
jgi:hypothetical protein